MAARQNHLDSIYRQMFGMKAYEDGTEEELIELGIIDVQNPHQGVHPPEFVMGEERGHGCGYPLDPYYQILYEDENHADEVNAYACASAHHYQYSGLAEYVLNFAARNNVNIILIDLANMGAGNLSDYEYNLDALPMVFRNRPVLYLAILSRKVIETVQFRHNKIIIPVVCLYPKKSRNRTRRCFGQTDDYLLSLLYQDIAMYYPDNVFVLSGDQYRWRGMDVQFTHPIKYVKLIRKPHGDSPFMLKNNDGHISRQSAFDIPKHNSAFLPQAVEQEQEQGEEQEAAAAAPPPPPNPTRKGVKNRWMFCEAALKGKKCPYGKKCTFAHTRDQLQEGKKQIKTVECGYGEKCTRQKCKFLHPQRGQTHIP